MVSIVAEDSDALPASGQLCFTCTLHAPSIPSTQSTRPPHLPIPLSTLQAGYAPTAEDDTLCAFGDAYSPHADSHARSSCLFPTVQVYAMVSVIADDTSNLPASGQRRRIFAHHAEQQRVSAVQAAQARAAQLVATSSVAAVAAAVGARGSVTAPAPAPAPAGAGDSGAVAAASKLGDGDGGAAAIAVVPGSVVGVSASLAVAVE